MHGASRKQIELNAAALSADMSGRWMTTQGFAEVTLAGETLRATLRFYNKGDDGIYHWVDATLDADNDVEAIVRSPNPEVDEFRLARTLFRGEMTDGVQSVMMLLTDGTTVLSLAYGPHSNEGNL
jgi:hypothetical protein